MVGWTGRDWGVSAVWVARIWTPAACPANSSCGSAAPRTVLGNKAAGFTIPTVEAPDNVPKEEVGTCCCRGGAENGNETCCGKVWKGTAGPGGAVLTGAGFVALVFKKIAMMTIRRTIPNKMGSTMAKV